MLIKEKLKSINNSKEISEIIEKMNSENKTLDDLQFDKESGKYNNVMNKIWAWWDEKGFSSYVDQIRKVNIQGGLIQLDTLSNYFGICRVIKIRGSNDACDTNYNFGAPRVCLEYNGFQYEYLRPIKWKEQVQVQQIKKHTILDKLSGLDPNAYFLYDLGEDLVKITNKNVLSQSKDNLNKLIYIERGKQSIRKHIYGLEIFQNFNKQWVFSKLLK
ncbi:hypothetical protein M0812_01551 [Anaeramoeba flamelloides]|uniref:Uncharacterized protein n=1 Tax=Anaeramoeba flamelloides TaxID=1746091 RepID=A0AAV7ZRV0_9EUKA|nr:hypothetical protein M0812_01551 [Anaeramoeba flamelloides]